MSILKLNQTLTFPPTSYASEEGIIAMGGDLSVERLLAAYHRGIFPWPHEGYPLLWFCPDPRFALKPTKAIINKSLKKSIRKNLYHLAFDTNFEEVIRHCAQNKRPHQNGTWITEEIMMAYTALHRRGFAHSVEAYENGKLVGGLYGVSLGGIFFGESMFALASDASKIAFASLIAHLIQWNFDLVDCQAHSDHLERLGAQEISRSYFLKILKHSLKDKPTKMGKWNFSLNSAECLKILKTCEA